MAVRYIEEHEIIRKGCMPFRVNSTSFALAMHLAKMGMFYVRAPDAEGMSFKVDSIKALRVADPTLDLGRAKLLFEEAQDLVRGDS